MLPTLKPSQRSEAERIMEMEDGDLSLIERVRKLASVDRGPAVSALCVYRPDIPPGKASAYIECESMRWPLYSWVDIGLARRFAFDSPGELQTFVSFHARLARALDGAPKARTHADSDYPNVWDVLKSLAVRDVATAERFASDGTYPLPPKSHFHTLYNAVLAVLRNDWAALDDMKERLSPKAAPKWIRGLLKSIDGIVRKDPGAVRDAISEVLDCYPRTDQISSLRKAVCFEAHGVYGLCRRVDPELVRDVNVTAKLPWDSGLHAACFGDDETFRLGADLRFVSQEFHDVVVALERPVWWSCDPQIGNAAT